MWVSPWDKFITEINQDLFSELWLNKGSESKKRFSLLTEHECQAFISIKENLKLMTMITIFSKPLWNILGMFCPLTFYRDKKWNLDQKGGESYTSKRNKPAKPKPHEDHNGMAKTRSAIILLHLHDEMTQIQAKCNGQVQLNGLKTVSPCRR